MGSWLKSSLNYLLNRWRRADPGEIYKFDNNKRTGVMKRGLERLSNPIPKNMVRLHTLVTPRFSIAGIWFPVKCRRSEIDQR